MKTEQQAFNFWHCTL